MEIDEAREVARHRRLAMDQESDEPKQPDQRLGRAMKYRCPWRVVRRCCNGMLERCSSEEFTLIA
jgi:hypothetical protein